MSVRNRVYNQIRGLGSSAVKVQSRLTVLDRLIARFRGAS